MVKPGDEILLGRGQQFRVIDLVPFEEEDESEPLWASASWVLSARRSGPLAPRCPNDSRIESMQLGESTESGRQELPKPPEQPTGC